LIRREPDDEYLKPTWYLNYDNPLVRERVEKVVAGCGDVVARAKAIYEFVRDQIIYNPATDVDSFEVMRASYTLSLGEGFCVQKAVLLSAMWRAAGIPSKVGFQRIRSFRIPQVYLDLLGDSIDNHGLSAFKVGDRWIRLDASLDRAMVERQGYRLVEFNSTRDELLHPTDIAGNPHFVILADYGDFQDVPHDRAVWLVQEFTRLHNEGWKSLVNQHGASM